MEKRITCFIITIVGVLIIITAQTLISIDNDSQENRVKYIKENLTELAKKCIREEKCTTDNITIEELEKKGYIDGYFMLEIKNYSKETYVSYPNYNVNLIEKNNAK